MIRFTSALALTVALAGGVVGASSADVDESDAAQLGSTVFLALRPPSAVRASK